MTNKIHGGDLSYKEVIEIIGEFLLSDNSTHFGDAEWAMWDFWEKWSKECEDREEPSLDLKVCPFCGGEAKHYLRHNDKKFWICYETDNWVGCTGSCGASTCMHETRDDAVEAWNKRV